MSIGTKRGFTLIELVIAISMFIVVMTVALDIFLKIIKFNRESVQKQSIQDHTEFLFGLMTKEIRMAKINYYNECKTFFSTFTIDLKLNQTYAVDNATHKRLFFQNYEGLCVVYYADTDPIYGTDRLKVRKVNPDKDNPRGGFDPLEDVDFWLLPSDIKVNDLYFDVQSLTDKRPDGPLQPPAVKMSLKLTSNIWQPQQVSFSNIIVGRNLEQF
jgi:prepilin-type N-terminal cleavage/methylation domain-containing protein